ncbi:alpha-protein kinase 1-like [Dreissena polymorpha]|uniref:Alpha-type protein kinase domain-containing protein n=1 Tax=Dreissena polymorpha TaxID=45954 RepID=A0A9D4DXL4_DREPO|nr:alpha-protein kinase 1-like [Dreissena polymorpha]KAH3768806.1 hypothetical protein DPMN_170022 [Dreissena polymorpha]
MGQQVSVETLSSSKDDSGHKYWASFDPYPFKVGSKKLSYMGILNGDGPLRGQKCVVKTIRNGAITRQDFLLESKRTKIARALSNFYNKIVPSGEKHIAFNTHITAEIDALSDCLCINDILGKPKKKFQEAEFVSIELYIKGKFEEFEYGWVSDSQLEVPEAFAHFSWCRSEGNMLVSNLQGVMTAYGYHLTGPTIHSEDKSFGRSDLGLDGIKGFFKLHRCNRLCRNWPRFGDGVDLRGWGEYIGMNDRRPSAPPYYMFFPSEEPPPYCADVVPYLQEDHMGLQESWTNHSASVTTSTHCEMSPSQLRGQSGIVLDWREEFFNQQMTFASGYASDNPMFQGGPSGSQLMWIVQQMRYAVYTVPPPYLPYPNQHTGAIEMKKPTTDNAGDDYFFLESDRKCLLPPPYSEESVDPEHETVTYL